MERKTSFNRKKRNNKIKYNYKLLISILISILFVLILVGIYSLVKVPSTGQAIRYDLPVAENKAGVFAWGSVMKGDTFTLPVRANIGNYNSTAFRITIKYNSIMFKPDCENIFSPLNDLYEFYNDTDQLDFLIFNSCQIINSTRINLTVSGFGSSSAHLLPLIPTNFNDETSLSTPKYLVLEAAWLNYFDNESNVLNYLTGERTIANITFKALNSGNGTFIPTIEILNAETDLPLNLQMHNATILVRPYKDISAAECEAMPDCDYTPEYRCICLPESVCNDTMDNDLDGAYDCEDTDCDVDTSCMNFENFTDDYNVSIQVNDSMNETNNNTADTAVNGTEVNATAANDTIEEPESPSHNGGYYSTDQCKSNITCSVWSYCNTNLEQERTCIDQNHCINDKIESRNCNNCQESWICSDWSVCSSTKQQYRTCVDEHYCDTNFNQPALQKLCTQTVVAGPQPVKITPKLTPPPITVPKPEPIVNKTPIKTISFWEQYQTLILAIVALILVVAIALGIIHLIHMHASPANLEELVNWISKERSSGKSNDEIRQLLSLSTDWKKKDIDKAFKRL